MRTKHAPSVLREFVKLRPEVEAVLQHVGLRTWDLVLIDVTGLWVRDEFASEEAAEATCRELGTRMHRGWDDPRIARRMSGRDHWNTPDGQRRAR
ncbi:MAG TPA: hypothetical protein VJO36_00075 [Actinomycetota bacterium]|nr:hypothetical protein [Actinomycetota bacterium]